MNIDGQSTEEYDLLPHFLQQKGSPFRMFHTSSSLLGAYSRGKPVGTKKTNLYPSWVHPRGMEYDMQVQAGSN